jgi:transposase
MKALIGVDPHKATVAVAAVDEVGELVECATFLQNRAGLRALERWAKRFPERRWAVENAGGLGRYLAQRLAAAGESVVDVPPSFQRGCGCSQPATLARTIDWTPSPPRSGRLAQRAAAYGRSRGRLRSAAPAFRKTRGLGR